LRARPERPTSGCADEGDNPVSRPSCALAIAVTAYPALILRQPPGRPRPAALDHIAHGSRVVFAVAGPAALEAAMRKGVYAVGAVGADIDQSYLGKFIFTGVVNRLGLAVYDLANRVVPGRLRTAAT
jgi:hypothetical protein